MTREEIELTVETLSACVVSELSYLLARHLEGCRVGAVILPRAHLADVDPAPVFRNVWPLSRRREGFAQAVAPHLCNVLSSSWVDYRIAIERHIVHIVKTEVA